jgi:signal recognition particle receptor subunit alpha
VALSLDRTQGGLVLWSRSFTPSPSPFDTLIREALIEERSTSSTSTSSSISTWSKDGYALLWTLANDLELIFVVAYQRILQLSYVDELLLQVKKAFLRAYEETVRTIVDSSKGKDVLVSGNTAASLFSGQGWAQLFEGWEDVFNRILRELELGAAKVNMMGHGPLLRRRLTDWLLIHRTSV